MYQNFDLFSYRDTVRKFSTKIMKPQPTIRFPWKEGWGESEEFKFKSHDTQQYIVI